MKKQFDPQDTTYRPITEISMSVYGRSACGMTPRRDVARGLHAVKISNRWMTTEATYREYKESQALRSVESMNGGKRNATATTARSDSKRAKAIAQAKRELADVPVDWVIKRLKFVADCNRRVLAESTPADYQIEYIDIGNVTSLGDVLELQSFEFKDAPSRARRKLTDGAVIISTVRTYLKAIAYLPDPAENLTVSTGFAVLEAKEELRPKFLYQALASEYFIQHVIAESKGVG